MNCDGWSMRDRRSQKKDTREGLRRHRKRCTNIHLAILHLDAGIGLGGHWKLCQTIYPFTVTFYSPRGGRIRADGDLNRGRPRQAGHSQGWRSTGCSRLEGTSKQDLSRLDKI